MRRLKAILQRFSGIWRKLNAEQAFTCTVDPDEFSSLLKSGRRQDLDLLAHKLGKRRSTPGPGTQSARSRPSGR
jgi:hypothetical protein